MHTKPKLIALDLRNATIENLEQWLFTADYIKSDITKEFLRCKVKERNDVEDPLEMVFILNDILFGFIQKKSFPAIDMFEPLIDDITNLTPITLDEIEPYRSVIIDWIFNTHVTKSKTANALRAFQKYKEDNNMMFPDFTLNVTAIDVEELGFNLKEFFVPTNDKFKTIVEEFENYYGEENYLKTVKLTRLFILDKFILGYVFQLEGEEYDHFFWNIHLDEHLLSVEKFSFEEKTLLSTDYLLDKIALKGIESLSIEERDFLAKQ